MRAALAVAVGVVGLWCAGQYIPIAHAQRTGDVRAFEVDPAWPKPRG